MSTRLPFRYGIAEMVAAPHVLVVVDVRDGTAAASGYASEHLPPKWFVKDPTSSFADEVADLTAAILAAAEHADGLTAATTFALALELDDRQRDWADRRGMAGLAAGLGSALVERATIDAVCRLTGVPFVDALERGVLGFDPALLHPELAGAPAPVPGRATRIAVRHTVGLGDPLEDRDVVDDPEDGLPVSLDSSIRRYGLRYVKLKTSGDAEADIDRLRRVERLFRRHDTEPRYTIDGNESMRSADHLHDWMEKVLGAPELNGVRERLVAVEQPLHRDVAMREEMAPTLRRLSGRAAVIVDESDGDREAVRRAMDLGYAGGTYKGCKGVFRGLANAALIARRGGGAVLTAEDLSTVPPLTVSQDLVVCAAMGLRHVERNGHHYFGRLAPVGLDEAAARAHPDLYVRDDARVRLRVERGSVRLESALRAPFGCAPVPSADAMDELTIDAAVALT